MKIRLVHFALLLVASVLFSCDSNKTKEIVVDKEKMKEKLKEANENFVKEEDQQIDDYLERRGWQFQKSATGLRYLVVKDGHGIIPKSGDKIYLDYTTSLIRGEVLYSSKTDGEKVFTIDYSDEISGLNEVVKYLKVGTEAKVVIPSYLAYGIHGDDNKILNKATIIMDIKIKKIIQN